MSYFTYLINKKSVKLKKGMLIWLHGLTLRIYVLFTDIQRMMLYNTFMYLYNYTDRLQLFLYLKIFKIVITRGDYYNILIPCLVHIKTFLVQ